MTLFIDENPIVGSLTQYRRGVNAYPEWTTNPLRGARMTSFGEVILNDEETRDVDEAVAYFRGKTHASKVSSIFQALTGLDRREFNRHGVYSDTAGMPMGFCNPDYAKVLEKGLEGVIEEAEQGIAPGRFPQYMYPHYKKDIQKGVLHGKNPSSFWSCCSSSFPRSGCFWARL